MPGVQRRDDADLMARAGERLGQRADHVGQAAGLRVRMNFAAGEQDFHASNRNHELP